MKEPRTNLQALDYNVIENNWSLKSRLLVWLAHLNKNNRVQLADTEIERLADAFAKLIERR